MSIVRMTARTLLIPATAAALIASSVAIAQAAVPGAASSAASSTIEPSPFLGLWELDLARMPDTYGPPPKRVTFTFEDVGSGKWRTQIEITAPDDSVRHGTVEYRRDGKAVQGEGNIGEADSLASQSPAPNVLVFSMAQGKRLSGVRTYAVSPNGQEMTESAAGADENGVPFVRNFHFKRIR